MSKERLEEIAYNVGISVDGEKALMSSDDYDFLYNYAKEQAERVEELEKKLNKQIEIGYKFEGEAYDLAEENKRYREALEFYADERNYEERDFGVIKQNAIQEGDKGNTARKALEESD